MCRLSTTYPKMFTSLWENRQLLRASISREVIGRYRGSFLGILWSFFNPLLMLAVYTFVFSVIFKIRWGTGSDSKSEFALLLFAGLLVFNLFSECVTRAPSLILSNPNYVKKVAYPLEILPWISFGSAAFHTLISFSVWLIVYCFFYGLPQLTIFLLPVLFIPFSLLIIALTFFLSSLGVYLRDISQIIGILTSALMFLSPIFYPASALPDSFRIIFYLNPLTFVIEQTRNLAFWGTYPQLIDIALFWIISIIFASLGYWWFQKTRRGFADVI